MEKNKSQKRLAPIDEDRRLIEESIPLKEISEESIKEKNIKRGSISILHVWWGRKPLAACRAAVFSSLVKFPHDQEKRKNLLNLVKDLCTWESSLNKYKIDKAKKYISESVEEENPKILDCFAGAGSIPLEALRLGCETYSLDLNPIAVLINKAILEYPQKYGRSTKKIEGKLIKYEKYNPLLEDFKKWGGWLKREVSEEISKFYPADNDGSVPVGYIWPRTVKCDNPGCGAEVPLLFQFWLMKNDTEIALKPIINKKNKCVDFEIAKGGNISFNPSEGIVRAGSAKCLVCGSIMDPKTLKKQVDQFGLGDKLIAIILRHPEKGENVYRIATDKDVKIFDEAKKSLDSKIEKWKGRLPLIPDEPISTPDNKSPSDKIELFFNFAPIVLYGMRRWGDLFNSRQQLVHIIFVEKIHLVYKEMLKQGCKEEYAKAIITYLALSLDSLLHHNCKLSFWYFGRLASAFLQGTSLPMRWTYVEANPFGRLAGTWEYTIERVAESILYATNSASEPGFVNQGTATHLPYKDDFFDSIIIDPGYYDAVPYSNLSDFFYVWLKRAVGNFYPELFSTLLTPKKNEIIENLSLLRGMSKEKALKNSKLIIHAKGDFERMLIETFMEIRRVLKLDGITTIIFAHKSTSAWESLINSLLNSGLIVTASWPIHTERSGRLRAQKSATLASSIFIVCRKRITEEEGYFNEIKDDLKSKIERKLNEFWNQGIRGADFFISAIGPAVEVFGKYKKVKRLSGEDVTVSELLDEVRKIVTDYSLHQILHDGKLGNIDDLTRFYVLWRWAYGDADVPFDDARKLAQALGTEPDELLSKKGLLKKKGDKVNMFEPWERKDEHLGESKHGIPASMIDVIHRACTLWEKNNKKALEEFIEASGYAKEEALWNVAQAISEILPDGNKEKQLLQGLLNTKTSIKTDKFKSQTMLNSYKGEEK